jgi:hypothetical protein
MSLLDRYRRRYGMPERDLIVYDGFTMIEKSTRKTAALDCAEELATIIMNDRDLAALALRKLGQCFMEDDKGRQFQQCAIALEHPALLLEE